MQELVGLSMAVEAYKITETDSAKIINYRSMNARGKLGEYGRNTWVSRGVAVDLQLSLAKTVIKFLENTAGFLVLAHRWIGFSLKILGFSFMMSIAVSGFSSW